MNRTEAKDLLPIIQAFAEGKTVEFKNRYGNWVNCGNALTPGFHEDFRIKPGPKYRPFKDADECWQEMQKHQPFGWVKRKGNKPSYELLACISENNEAPVCFASYGSADSGVVIRLGDKFDNIFNGFTFADGTPFGVKVEE